MPHTIPKDADFVHPRAVWSDEKLNNYAFASMAVQCLLNPKQVPASARLPRSVIAFFAGPDFKDFSEIATKIESRDYDACLLLANAIAERYAQIQHLELLKFLFLADENQ